MTAPHGQLFDDDIEKVTGGGPFPFRRKYPDGEFHLVTE